MNTKVMDIKFIKKEDIGIILQILLLILVIIFGIIYWLKNTSFMFYIFVSLLMFVMAFNNKYIYKKKYMTLVYVLVGLFVLISTLVEVIV